MSRTAILVLSFALYLVLVRLLRFRRAHAFSRRHGFYWRSDLKRMTAAQAQAILRDMIELEMPWTIGTSIGFAFFKTYGIPTISRVLASTGELNDTVKSSRRYADTVAIGLEFLLKPRDSDRSRQAIARMNWLHERYQRAGMISNKDMLYTLALFAVEPAAWIERFEWRSLTVTELCALGTFVKATGDDMGIDFSPVGPTTDGLEFFKAIRRWTRQYELQNMEPCDVSDSLAETRLEEITQNMPGWKATVARQAFLFIMPLRLRFAVQLSGPGPGHEIVFSLIFAARRFYLRHLALPRLFRADTISAKPVNGRYHLEAELSLPWYIKPTLYNRWGPVAWITWLEGGKVPGDDGDLYLPQGYKIDELGPEKLQGQGKAAMAADVEKMRQRGTGCPFH